MQLGSAPLAFCDTFDTAFPITNRSGQLNGTLWGVSRLTGNSNFGYENAWRPGTIDACNGPQSSVPGRTDVIVCNGQLRNVTNDNHTVTTLALYPKQPFDFAGRTGTVSFDVTNDTSGTHGAWPEFWLTDQPIPAPFIHSNPCDMCASPRNSLGIRFAANLEPFNGSQVQGCPSDNVRRWTVDSFVVTRNYVFQEYVRGFSSSVDGLGCVTSSSGPNGLLNHIELRINQQQVEVWASDAGSKTLKLIARLRNANLSFTRGLVWIEDSHYNADKSPFPAQVNHTYTWDNVAFDGPAPYRDLSFDVLDRMGQNSDGTVSLGYTAASGSSVTVSTLPMTAENIAPATSALLMFNYGHASGNITSFNYRINGNQNTAASPMPSNLVGWRTIALPVPLNQLVAGQQNIVLSGSSPMIVANINIVLIAATGVPGVFGPQPPANLRIIR